ncbi:protein abnormal spindle-like, partial [Rhagoletis pomonella]|uniref:protein abnormal spindle-like n=2 Tax=Rhagoletis pomonella TaxID=28610 RepID=UPI0017868B07
MSAFEVVLTPTHPKCKKRIESREPTDVVMAPFSAKSIVTFEDVPVGKTARRILRIVNPSEDNIEVRVIKPISEEYNVSISWDEIVIPRSKTVEMEMVWNPLEQFTCKETLQLLDNRNFRKDVMVIMKTRVTNPIKSVRKFPTISTSNSSYVRTLRLKSPKGATKSHKSSSAQTQSRKPPTTTTQRAGKPPSAPSTTQVRAPPPRSVWADTKCNLREEQKREVFDEITINFTHTSPLSERNIYARNKAVNTAMPTVSSNKSPVLLTHKENVSPMTPSNVIKMFDKIQFTPINSGDVKSGIAGHHDLDNLASWPTPVSVDSVKVNLSTMRPRRLTSANESADFLENTNTTHMTVEFHMDQKSPGSAVITNKTFEVRHENINISTDSLDTPVCYGVTLNKTTTITTTPKSRPLAMIEEEDTSLCSGEPEKTYVKNKSEIVAESSPVRGEEDLLRDIKLVGTPLRKYSESMKDLSLRSPSKRYSASQGSMPNLNEMECIRSIEQNRYFFNNRMPSQGGLISEASTPIYPPPKIGEPNTLGNESAYVDLGIMSQADLAFNQSEILAQSSRFNLNEVGVKSRRSSPVPVSGKWRDLRGVSPKSSKVKLSEYSPSKSNKRNSQDLSFSDAPSSESLATTSSDKSSVRSCSSKSKNAPSSNKNMSLILVSPPKRQRVDNDFTFERPSIPGLSRSKNWSRTQVKKMKIVKPTTPKKVSPPNIQLS